MQSNPNTKIYIIAAALWLVVIGVGVAFFVFFGSKLFAGNRAPYANPNTLFMVSANEGWAVGSSEPFTPTATTVTSPSSQLDAGCVGVALHYTTTTWLPEPIPGCININSISMVSPAEGWAVSEFGIIAHYNDGRWTKVSSISGITDSSGLRMEKVSVNQTGEAWANGYIEGKAHNTPVLLHYSGGEWKSVASPLNSFIYDVSTTSAGDAWATAGLSGTDSLLHYSNGTWTKVDNPAITNLRDISVVSNDEVWVVNNKDYYSSIWRYKDGIWSSYAIAHTGTQLGIYSIRMISSNSGWAAGVEEFGSKIGPNSFVTQSTHEVVLRYDGSNWMRIDPPSDSGRMSGVSSIYGISADEAWLVDFGGIIWHYQNGSWSKDYAP